MASPFGLIRRVLGGTPAPQRRSYEAAGAGPRWPKSSHMHAPAAEAHAAGQTIASRVASLVANDPHAAAIVNAWVSNIVADGPAFRPNAAAEETTEGDVQ